MKLITFEMRMTFATEVDDQEPPVPSDVMHAAVEAAQQAVKDFDGALLCRTGYGIPRGGVIEVDA